MLLKIFFVIILFTNQSCIYLNKNETRPVKINSEKIQFEKINDFGPIQLSSLKIEPSQFPLESFFSNLLQGQYDNLFKKFDLNYTPSNTDNDILKKLLDEKIIPYIVKIKNNSNEEITIGSDHFYLTDGSKRIFALNNTQIPYTFKEFYPEAVAANTYNTVITTAGILVVLTSLVVIGMTSGVHFPGSQNNSFYNENSSLSKNGLPQPQNYSNSKDDKAIWNSTSKTIKADYEHLLFDKRSLKPHEEAFALILFSKTQVKKMSPLNLFYLF